MLNGISSIAETVGAVASIANDHPPEDFRDVIQRHYGVDGKDDWTFSLLDLFGDFHIKWLGRLWEGQLYVHEECRPTQEQVSGAP